MKFVDDDDDDVFILTI